MDVNYDNNKFFFFFSLKVGKFQQTFHKELKQSVHKLFLK